MRKMIVIIVILLSLFTLWYSSDKEEIAVEKEKKVEVSILLEKDSNEVIETPSIEAIGKVVVNLGEDRNVTKETNLTLEANLTNYDEEYQYIWKEKDNIIGTGKVLTKPYSKGSHLIKLEVFLDDKFIGKDEVLVTAWDYIKEEVFFKFEQEKGEMRLISTKIFNHLNQLLFSTWNDSQTLYKYSDFNKIVEKDFEHYTKPKKNYTKFYHYNSEHNLTLIEIFNYEDKLLSTKKYDENGKEVIEHRKSEQESRYVEKEIKYKKNRNEDGNLTHIS